MIALCEDNERDMRLILDMLDEWEKETGQRTGVRCFPDAEALLDAIADGRASSWRVESVSTYPISGSWSYGRADESAEAD